MTINHFPYPDSPKLRNKGQKVNKARPTVNLRRQSTSAGATRKLITSAPSTLVVVNKGGGAKDVAIEKDPDVVRLQVKSFITLLRRLVRNYKFELHNKNDKNGFKCRASPHQHAVEQQSHARSKAFVVPPAHCIQGQCEKCWI